MAPRVAPATVAVAMSGGVDSSVAAALCVRAGYSVFGIMLRLWSEPGATASNKCCTLGAIDDARAVANMLDIPFAVIDAGDYFKATVVDAFVARSLAGETPNPCFTCNRRVRFGFLLERALALGADTLATGHYARTQAGPDGTVALLRGVDRQKDQSYVLHALTQPQLQRAMFPVGGHTKPEVRDLAAQFDLPTASRRDSVDLCWVGERGVSGFLERSAPASLSPGPIRDRSGRILGSHAGLPRYTVGQRRGLGVAGSDPQYVLERDWDTNTLVIGPPQDLLARKVTAMAVGWIGDPPAGPIRGQAQIRYGAQAADAVISPQDNETVLVEFDEPQRAISPGQGLVMYQGDVVLGGGTIHRAV